MRDNEKDRKIEGERASKGKREETKESEIERGCITYGDLEGNHVLIFRFVQTAVQVM